MPSRESHVAIERIALVVHPSRPDAKTVAARLREWWESRGVLVVDVGGNELEADGDAGGFSFAISLGGDGTMLRAVRFAAPRGIPIAGVNLGGLGYLTEIEPSRLEEAFGRLVSGEFDIDERMILDVQLVHSDGGREHHLALNDAVIERNRPGRTVRVGVSIADMPFLSCVADGVLVATPTGSTAYNLSVRGPILSPTLRALILTPISPHMLFDRSLVLDPSEEIRLEILEGPPAVLVIDGYFPTPVESEDVIVISASEQSARFVRLATPHFHAILRAKFGLADR